MAKEFSVFCTYIIAENGSKCQNIAIKGSIYCNLHMTNSTYVCEGLKMDGTKCRAFKRKGSRFCRPEHDPELERSTDTLEFREPNLRNISRLSSLLLNQNNRDCFTEEIIKTWKNPGDEVHIDHFFELNLARDLYDRIRNKHDPTELSDLKSNVKDVINKEFNLGLTDEKINQSKSAAIQNFANDYKSESVDKDGLKFYFRNAPKIRTRGLVSKIIDKVTTSVDLITDHLTNDLKDTSSKADYMLQLEEMVKTWNIDS